MQAPMTKVKRLILIGIFCLLTKPLFAINDVYVVHLILDGLRYDVLNEAIQKGELPHLKEHFVDQGTVFENALTVFPTASTPGYVAFATGLGSGDSGVFFLEWFDRTKKKVVGYLTPSGYKRSNIDLLNRPALFDENEEALYPPTTLFEKLEPSPTAAIFTPFYRGATIRAPKKIPFAALWHALVTHNGRSLNKIAMKNLQRIFSKRFEKIPRYSLVGLYSTDYIGHKSGPTSEEIDWNLKEFDQQFYKFLNQLESLGIKDKTYLIVSSDHGMHETGKLLDLKKALWKKGIRERSKIYIGNRGVSSTFIYVQSEKGWETLPTLSWLKNFPIKNKTMDLIETLTSLEEVEWIAVRDGLDRVRLFNAEGDCVIHRLSVGGKAYYSYSFNKKDPLDYQLDEKVRSAEEWLQLTVNAERPNGVVSISNLFQDPRAGDILVVAKAPWSFRKAKAGTHGSLTQEDMHIPLWIAGPNIPKSRQTIAKAEDLYSMILSWFGFSENHQVEEAMISGPALQLAKLENNRIGQPPLFKIIDKESVAQEARREIGASSTSKMTSFVDQEGEERYSIVKKLKNLQAQLADRKNPLKIPKKIRESMQWLLAQEETAWLQRVRRMEDIKQILEYR